VEGSQYIASAGRTRSRFPTNILIDTMSESKDIKFEGWGAFDKTSIQGNFKWFEYEPKTFCEDDIECMSSSLVDLLMI
jgi:hypothetical protein